MVSGKTGTWDLTTIPNSVAGEEELSWAKKALFSTKPCWWHSVEPTEAAWAQHCCWASQGWVSRGTFLHGAQQYCGLLGSGLFSQFLPNLEDVFYYLFFFWHLRCQIGNRTELWRWLCFSLGKSTCISFYWSVNIGEVVSPAAVRGCSVCQMRASTSRMPSGMQNCLWQAALHTVCFPSEAGRNIVRKISLSSEIGISRLLTSDTFQCWMISVSCAWFE